VSLALGSPGLAQQEESIKERLAAIIIALKADGVLDLAF